MFLHMSVILSTGGVCHTHPRWADTPWADTPPPRANPQTDTPSAQCMLGYGQQVGGTHPTGMHSCVNDYGVNKGQNG